MGILRPDIYVNKIFNIKLDELKKKGFKALLLDVDNTLKPHYVKLPSDEVRRWLDNAKEKGFQLSIVSNGRQHRIEAFAHGLDMMAIGDAMKPSPKGFLRAAKRMNLDIKETCVVGDQIFTDIWGGNRAGALTILVRPMEKHEPFYISFKRFFEKIVLIGVKPEEEK